MHIRTPLASQPALEHATFESNRDILIIPSTPSQITVKCKDSRGTLLLLQMPREAFRSTYKVSAKVCAPPSNILMSSATARGDFYLEKKVLWCYSRRTDSLFPSFVGFTHAQTPQFARGNVFSNQPSQQQLQEQDKYKAYLKQQVPLQTTSTVLSYGRRVSLLLAAVHPLDILFSRNLASCL